MALPPMRRPDPVHFLIPEGWQRLARGTTLILIQIVASARFEGMGGRVDVTIGGVR